jgi:hypothetical protein
LPPQDKSKARQIKPAYPSKYYAPTQRGQGLQIYWQKQTIFLGLGDCRLYIANLRLNNTGVFLDHALEFKFFVTHNLANYLFDFANSLVGTSFEFIFVDTHN